MLDMRNSGGMQDLWDAGFKKGGTQEMRNTGKEGFRTGGIQERQDSGEGMQDRRDVRQ